MIGLLSKNHLVMIFVGSCGRPQDLHPMNFIILVERGVIFMARIMGCLIVLHVHFM
jgi:hypothetical protein